MPTLEERLHKLRGLVKALSGRSWMLIILQDRPDPDGLASAMALRILSVGFVTVSLRKSEYVIIFCLLRMKDIINKIQG